MSRMKALRQMKDVLAIRCAQRHGAEMDVKRAQNTIDELAKVQGETVSVVTAAYHEWERLTSGPRLSLPIARAWGQTIAQAEAGIADLAMQLKDAEAVKSARLDAHRVAEARQGAAVALTRAIHRRVLRKAEEAQAAALEDQSQQARWTS